MSDVQVDLSDQLQTLRIRDTSRRWDARGRLVVKRIETKPSGCASCSRTDVQVSWELHVGLVEFSDEMLEDPVVAASGTWTKILVDVCDECLGDLAASIARQTPTKESR